MNRDHILKQANRLISILKNQTFYALLKMFDLKFIIICMSGLLLFSTLNLHACPDCSISAHTIGQPFFAHVMPESTYEGTPLERNLAREMDHSNEECTQCGGSHE